jgi:hypothetical protein
VYYELKDQMSTPVSAANMPNSTAQEISVTVLWPRDKVNQANPLFDCSAAANVAANLCHGVTFYTYRN